MFVLTDIGAFERRRYMNLVVHKAKHPELQEYIHSSVNGLLPFLEKVVNSFYVFCLPLYSF